MRPVFIKTFGCKVNYTESVAFSELLAASGFDPLEMSGAALPAQGELAQPVVFVNSCCVTREAERKAAQFVRRIRREHPHSTVLFTGCGARNQSARRQYEEAGALVFDFYTQALDWLKQHFDAAGSAAIQPLAGNAQPSEHFGPEEPSAPFESGIVQAARSRVFIKVQDGCHNCCAFCIIPFVRSYSSLPVAEILDEVDKRVAQGFRELVLTGINIGHYGQAPAATVDEIAHSEDWRRPGLYEPLAGHPSFFDLVDLILDRLPVGHRLRISSIEPEDIADRFFEQFQHPAMCPHLHLPLQSGSDEVLESMRRRYTVAQYIEVADRFRKACPEGALTTDILVGFPSETDRHFQETLKICSEVKFERIHGFPFSPRPGTSAAKLTQHPRKEIQARNRLLIEHCKPIADQRWRRFVGKTSQVLIEEPVGEGWLGHGEAYQVVGIAPAHDGPQALEPGQIVTCRLADYRDGRFMADALPSG